MVGGRKTAASIASVLLAGSMTLVAPAPAMAAPHRICGDNLVCWYDAPSSASNYNIGASGAIPSGACLDLNASGQDAHFARWAINDTGFPARFWSNPNCTGSSVLVLAGTISNDFPFTAFGLGGY